MTSSTSINQHSTHIRSTVDQQLWWQTSPFVPESPSLALTLATDVTTAMSSARVRGAGKMEKEGARSLASVMFTITFTLDSIGELALSEEVCICGVSTRGVGHVYVSTAHVYTRVT